MSQQNGVREVGQKQYKPDEIPASKVRFGEGRKGNNKSYLVLNITATSHMACLQLTSTYKREQIACEC